MPLSEFLRNNLKNIKKNAKNIMISRSQVWWYFGGILGYQYIIKMEGILRNNKKTFAY